MPRRGFSTPSDTTLIDSSPASHMNNARFCILPIFQCLGNFKTKNHHHALIGKTVADDWKQFLSAANTITHLKINQSIVEEMNSIGRSTWFQIARQLGSLPVFPSLRELEVENLDDSIQYLSLLVSPSLEAVHIHPPSPDSGRSSPKKSTHLVPPIKPDDWEQAFEALVFQISESVPKLKTLTIVNTPHTSASLLKPLARLSKLHCLELRHMIDVKDFNDIRPILGSLSNLGSLSIDFQTPGLHPTALRPLAMDNFLPSLTGLELIGATEVVFDFVRALGTKVLERLVLKCKSSSFISGHERSEKTDIFTLVGSRWLKTLREVRITAGSSELCDIELISNFGALRQLCLEGCIVESLERSMVSPVTKSSCWRALEVLKLPINYPISLQNLRSIAEATPSLSTASLNIDLSIIPSFYATGPINHRLQTLTTTGNSEDVHRSQRKKDRDKMEFMLDVVHHLDLLFPELKLLSSSPIDNFWNEAWKVLRLCHKIREDEEGRKKLKSQC